MATLSLDAFSRPIKYLDIHRLDIEASPRETRKCCFVFLWKILLLNWGYFYGFSLFFPNNIIYFKIAAACTYRNRIILFTQLRAKTRERLSGDDGNNK